jgi:hypothetical protein
MKEIPAMSHANPTAPPGADERTPNTQTLVAQLEDLMPLLIGIQQAQTFGSRPAQLEPGNFIESAMLDHQAAASLAQDITGDCLRTLTTYLETHAGRHAELQGCVGLATQALHRYAARDYAQAFVLIWQTYRTITAARARNPQLPPLRTSGPAYSSSTPPTTSIH